MKAIDDEADIRQVLPDCVDIGVAHIATGPTDAFSLFVAERVLKEAIDRLPAFTFAHPQDAGAIQVVDDRGELPAFAVRDLIDPHGGQAAYSVPVARPVDDPVQQVRQRRARHLENLGGGLLRHDLTQRTDAIFEPIRDPGVGRCPGDLFLDPAMRRTLDLLGGVVEDDSNPQDRCVFPSAHFAARLDDAPASLAVRAPTSVLVWFDREMQLLVAIPEFKVGNLQRLQAQHSAQ